jgi:D-alanyl-D-alanine carboxypeptidase
MIQVSAFDAEDDPRADQPRAVQVGDMLKDATPSTDAVHAGDRTFYRAGFAGMQRDRTEAICRYLKRDEFA